MLRTVGIAAALSLLAGPALAQSKLTVAAYGGVWDSHLREKVFPDFEKKHNVKIDYVAGNSTDTLAKLGAEVVAIDQAPLDPRIAAMPGVQWRGESAFALEPESVGAVDWLFSDIVCYPARLLRLVERWRSSGLAKNFICTIKFQGETDHESAAAFAAIPGAQVLHLHHNKHELTFMLSSEPGT